MLGIVVRKISRVVTGFHRLGIVLAGTVLLAALGTAISAWFSDDGPDVPDPSSAVPLTVYTPKDQADIRERIHAKKLESIYQFEVDTGPIRTFAFYPTMAGQPSTPQQTVSNILESIMNFERRRGIILNAQEQPLVVGDVFVQEVEKPQYGYRRWTHLKHGFDWQRIAVAGGIAAFAVFIYVVARLLGWVIDGFVSRAEA